MTDPKRLGDARGEWYYCLKHHQVEGLDGCLQTDRMGPYPTRQEAEDWQARVEARNKEWEDDDEA